MLGGGVLGSVACSAVLELRVSFLAGAGVSVDATNEALRQVDQGNPSPLPGFTEAACTDSAPLPR